MIVIRLVQIVFLIAFMTLCDVISMNEELDCDI
jgi:hypothetical protein